MGGLINILKQIRAFLQGLSPVRRISFVLILALVLGGMIAVFLWGNRTEYRLLCSDLDPQDANVVVDALKNMKIPYRFEAGGSKILVPAGKFYDARLKLAGNGLPFGGDVGYELFDQPKLGMSEYMQRLNFRRALQGELARTISQLEEVRRARVHIVVPERRLFEESQPPATASVVLKLNRGAQLSRKQVRGVVNLVSKSVEGLQPDQVTIVDTSGNVLFGGLETSPSGMLTQSQQEMKTQIEQTLQRKVQTMLERTVGKGKVRVQVTAVLTTKETRETREIYDPDKTVVRSEQSQKEETIGDEAIPSGVPGVKPNVQGVSSGGRGQTRNVSRKSGETINYEVTRVVQKVYEPAGDVEKLSIAVMVDGTYQKQTDAKGREVLKYIPRSAEELAKYKRIAQNAVGYDAARGDQVAVINLPFQQEEAGSGGEEWLREQERRRLWTPFIRYGIMLALVSIVVFFVLRPLLKMVASPPLRPEEQKLLEEEEHARLEMAEQAPQIEQAEEDALSKVREIAEQDPVRVARMIRAWVK